MYGFVRVVFIKLLCQFALCLSVAALQHLGPCCQRGSRYRDVVRQLLSITEQLCFRMVFMSFFHHFHSGFYLSRGFPDATAALLCCQHTVVLVNYLFPFTFSLSLNLFIRIALSVVILAHKRNAGSDRVPLWPTKHFG